MQFGMKIFDKSSALLSRLSLQMIFCPFMPARHPVQRTQDTIPQEMFWFFFASFPSLTGSAVVFLFFPKTTSPRGGWFCGRFRQNFATIRRKARRRFCCADTARTASRLLIEKSITKQFSFPAQALSSWCTCFFFGLKMFFAFFSCSGKKKWNR